VLAGSSDGAHPDYRDAAVALGRELADNRVTLVYGGAAIGLMGAIADAALDAGGEVIGVLPQALLDREGAHPGLTELRVVDSMHDRKALTSEISDAFVALPGGLGTFEELLEVATWTQLGVHAKPCGTLNVRGFYDRLFGLLDHAVAEAFLSPGYREVILVEEDPATLLGRLASWNPPSLQ
jgi:uncharacterized protein (TIGR00730 family)